MSPLFVFVELCTDVSFLPRFVQQGCFRDHTRSGNAGGGDGDDSGLAAYPAPFNDRLRPEGEAARNKQLLAEKMARRAQSAGGEMPAAVATGADASTASPPPAPSASPDGSAADSGSVLHLQSREEMRASIDEFLLPDFE